MKYFIDAVAAGIKTILKNMEYSLSMIFLTETGGKSPLTLSGVRGDVTAAESTALMDIYIANNIFISTKGALVSKYDAKLTEKTVTDFTV